MYDSLRDVYVLENIMFDPRITFGNLVEVLVIALGGLFFLWELRTKLTILQITYDQFDKKLEKLDIEFKELAKVTTIIATQTERLNSFEHQLASIALAAQENFKTIMAAQEIFKATIFSKPKAKRGA